MLCLAIWLFVSLAKTRERLNRFGKFYPWSICRSSRQIWLVRKYGEIARKILKTAILFSHINCFYLSKIYLRSHLQIYRVGHTKFAGRTSIDINTNITNTRLSISPRQFGHNWTGGQESDENIFKNGIRAKISTMIRKVDFGRYSRVVATSVTCLKIIRFSSNLGPITVKCC